MNPPGVDAALEPELRVPLPRRPRWRRARWRLWLRLLLFVPLSLLLVQVVLSSLWLLLLASLGTPLEARIVERSAAAQAYHITLEYPKRSWRGAEQPAREVMSLSMAEWGALVRARSLPARRLGRGRLQVVHIETDGTPLEASSLALGLFFGLAPVAVAGLTLMWRKVVRDWWLVRWGRPVRGRVRSRSRHGTHWTRYALAYEYREVGGPGGSAMLHGTVAVTRDQFDEAEPGLPVTILHALWNPRWHVPYPFCRFAARDDTA